MGTIKVTDQILIEENEVQLDFIRASGPGGQNVNKVSSAVQLRFDTGSASLPDDVRDRLVRLGGKRVTEEGILQLESSRYRTQEKNREDVLQRLVELIRHAAEEPKVRKKTRVPQKVNEHRLETKRRKSVKKRLRSQDPFDE